MSGRRVAGALVLLLAVFIVATVVLFVLPASDDAPTIRSDGPVDAVVVLGGSPQDRLEAAIGLAAVLPEPPPTLVLAVQYEAPVISCGRAPSLPRVPLRCFAPAPATTAGEAVWLAREAAAEGWRHVVVVTSDYHVTRTRVLVERCVAAIAPATDVAYLAAAGDDWSLRGAWRIATEWPSLLGTPWDHRPACAD